MDGYRHLNVLVSGKTYDALREAGYKSHKPVSELVRTGIQLVLKNQLKNQSCKGEGKSNEN
ncbi:MAG: hypothetical protein A2W74_03815 [Planctomycetes bacterium RIFCSPLOWO2_12_38_17]|nr:MAG: hypothetical protein A2W74_03815 [Planctomycetes bacterium RIFCSPLOWO2_12_38_17]